MSDTPENPQSDTPSNPTTETPAAAAPAASESTPAEASSRRGVWKYVGVGAIGVLLGALLTGALVWGFGDDGGGGGRKGDRMSYGQQKDGGSMSRGGRESDKGGRSDDRGGRMPGGQMPNGQMPNGQTPPAVPTPTVPQNQG